LGKRGLYPTVSRKGQYDEVFKMVNFLSYADGKNDLIDISNIIKVPVCQLLDLVKLLKDNDLIEIVN
jgi:aminopeptidase-like protein